MSETENYELAEISAAKDQVHTVLELHLADPENEDLIGVADKIVDTLVGLGVKIPEWMPQPFNRDLPAQGYYPTSSQMEAWNGKPVTPKRVTGR